jgi:putative amino-acid transport system ATP-binding protein
MLTINNLKKSFDTLDVLKGIDLRVKKGEVISIIGPSGSGKSTLLKSINFLANPDSGEIIIDNYKVDIKESSEREKLNLRRKTSMVFQDYNLFKNKNALENITESLIITRKIKKVEAERIAYDLLEQVGLKDKANNYPSELSGGQQQRVAIARALALEPNVILFDEPTSALDPELVAEVLEVIESLARKDITMLIVTHEMEFARKVSDRIIFMYEGKVRVEETPEKFFGTEVDERLQKFLGTINR